ncbi:MAG: hypothetical protein IJI75_14925 [Solobacterium sp.]|nr:hypothetical protein [Solobacterium sp.]MDO5122743.1 hypothetical protein [Erysipelotrichaceae bacterium]
MLAVTGIIVIVIQFAIDAYSISTGSISFRSFTDVFGHYIFGIVGISLFLIDRAAYKRKAEILQKRYKKLKGQYDEEDYE